MNVLIAGEVTQNWPVFATWFSVWKNIPEANVSLMIERSGETPFQLFQWAKRLKVPVFFTKREFAEPLANNLKLASQAKHLFKEDGLLILTALTMVLSQPNLTGKIAYGNEDAIFIPHISDIDSLMTERVLNNLQLQNGLCVEAKDVDDVSSIVSYKKGCGRWINTLKGCPFSNAAGLALAEMTPNENRIISMWKQMVPLYDATA